MFKATSLKLFLVIFIFMVAGVAYAGSCATVLGGDRPSGSAESKAGNIIGTLISNNPSSDCGTFTIQWNGRQSEDFVLATYDKDTKQAVVTVVSGSLRQTPGAGSAAATGACQPTGVNSTFTYWVNTIWVGDQSGYIYDITSYQVTVDLGPSGCAPLFV